MVAQFLLIFGVPELVACLAGVPAYGAGAGMAELLQPTSFDQD